MEEAGYAMAKLIERQILRADKQVFNLKVMPGKIIERASTNRYNIMDENVLVVVKFINENYMTELDTRKLLQLVPLSRRNLETKFKAVMGVSIYQYILNCRCEKLANLLIESDMGLAEAAYEAGFNAYGNISRIFKKHKGLTPSEFRKAYRTR